MPTLIIALIAVLLLALPAAYARQPRAPQQQAAPIVLPPSMVKKPHVPGQLPNQAPSAPAPYLPPAHTQPRSRRAAKSARRARSRHRGVKPVNPAATSSSGTVTPKAPAIKHARKRARGRHHHAPSRTAQMPLPMHAPETAATVQDTRKAQLQAQHEAADRARQEADLKAQQKAALLAQHEAELKAQHEAALQTKQEAADRASQDAERRAQQKAALLVQHEADLKAQYEVALQAKQEAADKARQDAELKTQHEAKLKAQHEAALQAKQEAADKARQEAELKAQQKAALQAQHEAELKAQHEAALQAKQEAADKARQEAELKAQQKAALQAKQEADLKAQQQAAVQAKQAAAEQARRDAELKAQQRAALQAQHEADLKAQQEAATQAALQAQRQAELQAQQAAEAQQQAELQARQEAALKAQQQAASDAAAIKAEKGKKNRKSPNQLTLPMPASEVADIAPPASAPSVASASVYRPAGSLSAPTPAPVPPPAVAAASPAPVETAATTASAPPPAVAPTPAAPPKAIAEVPPPPPSAGNAMMAKLSAPPVAEASTGEVPSTLNTFGNAPAPAPAPTTAVSIGTTFHAQPRVVPESEKPVLRPATPVAIGGGSNRSAASAFPSPITLPSAQPLAARSPAAATPITLSRTTTPIVNPAANAVPLSTAIPRRSMSATTAPQPALPSAAAFPGLHFSFIGADAYSVSELINLSGILPGQAVDSDMLTHANQRFVDSGLFADASANSEAKDGVETLTFNLHPIPQSALARPSFANFIWLTPAEIDSALNRIPLYRGLLPAGGNGPLVDSVQATLAQLLSDKGVHASVGRSPVPPSARHPYAAVVFRVTDPEVRLAATNISGAPGALIQAEIAAQRTAVASPYNQGIAGDTTEDILLAPSRNSGYLEAHLADVTMQRHTMARQVNIDLTARIVAGRQYRVGRLDWVGSDVYSAADFKRQSPMHTGDLTSGPLLDLTQRTILAAYRSQGYLDAQLDTTTMLDPTNGLANYNFVINPGEPYRVHIVSTDGLSPTAKAQFDKAFTLKPGDLLNDNYLQTFLLLNPSQKELTQYTYTYQLSSSPETHQADITMQFKPR